VIATAVSARFVLAVIAIAVAGNIARMICAAPPRAALATSGLRDT
jgi:hypothetical protein